MNIVSKSGVPVANSSYAVEGGKSNIDGRDVAFIDARTLTRECFVRALESQEPGLKVLAFASVDDWDTAEAVDLVFYNIGAGRPSDATVGAQLRKLVEGAAPAPVIVLADSEAVDVMLEAFQCGARGCVPASVGIETLLQASRMALLGGVFLPASAASALRRTVELRSAQVPDKGLASLTLRQAAVAEALRHGKSNKIIAYELNMSENTVKVHIRSILKKLHATNRTEAAFRLNSAALGSAEPLTL